RDREHLLLAARERPRDLAAALAQARKGRVQRFRVAAAAHVGAHSEVLLDRELAEDAATLGNHDEATLRQLVHLRLRQVGSGVLELARSGWDQPADRLERGGLAR